MNFAELVQLYLQSPEFEKLEPNSKGAYSLYMGRLASVGGELPVSGAMQQPVAPKRSRVAVAQPVVGNLSSTWYRLINEFKTSEGPATNSMKMMLRTNLKVVYGWAVLAGIVAPNENPAMYIPRFKHELTQKHPMTISDIGAIEKLIQTGGLSEYLLAYAMFSLFAFYSGCRPEEMYTHETRWFLNRDGKAYMQIMSAKGKAKGVVSRLVLMTEKEISVLQYFAQQPIALGQGKFTFRTSNGRQFKQSNVSIYTREVYKLAGVEPRAFYNNRRGLATAMYKSKKYTIPEIANRLGNSERVVRRYIIEDNVEKSNSYKGL